MRTKTLVATTLAAGTIALWPANVTQAEPEFVVNFGTVAPDGTPWADQLKDIKKRVEADSGGAIKLKLFLGGTLGGEVEMVRDIRRNARLQGGGFSTAAIAEGANVPLLQLPELPYLFHTLDEADYILDNVLFDPIAAELQPKGFVLTIWAENGWRSFATKGGPIHSAEDLQKYKMRCQETDVHERMYKALGVDYVTLPVSEVLTGLQTGIVTGFDNTPLFTQAAGWYEPVTHYNLSRHIYQPAAIVWGTKFWDQLSPDMQKIVLGDPKAEAAKGRKAVRELESELLANFPTMGVEVVELSDAEREALAAKTKGVHLEFAKTVEGGTALLKTVNTELKNYRASH